MALMSEMMPARLASAALAFEAGQTDTTDYVLLGQEKEQHGWKRDSGRGGKNSWPVGRMLISEKRDAYRDWVFARIR